MHNPDETLDPDLTAVGAIAGLEESSEDTEPQSAEAEQNSETYSHLNPGDPCPRCGAPLTVRYSEKGELLGCSDYPQCTFMIRFHQSVRDLLPLNSTCPRCGATLMVKRGRFGIFIGCSRYPECTFTDVRESLNLECPICHKGHLRGRTSRRGSLFYGCDNYPHCTFMVPGEPVLKPCPTCGFPLRYKKKVKAGTVLKCPNPLCPDRRKRKLEKVREE